MSKKWNASTIAKLGLLTAVAIVLGYFEHLLPVSGIPGVKLGLANTVLLYALYLLDVPSAILLMFLKVGVSGLLFGGPAAMLLPEAATISATNSLSGRPAANWAWTHSWNASADFTSVPCGA